MQIAVVQFQIAHLQREINSARIESFIQKAKSHQSDVVIFPEDCITGSIFGDRTKLDHQKLNRDAWVSLAKKYRIDLVTGSVMEACADGNFNTSYYIDASGAVLGMYRKNHLYPSEQRFLNSGTDVPVFDTSFGKAGIVICWDMLCSEIFERMRSQGVQIVYCPSYWYQEIASPLGDLNQNSEGLLLDALCLTRAVETNCAIVYCNAAGVMNYSDGSTDTLIGHSQVVLPVLGAIDRCLDNLEQIRFVSLSLESLDASAKIYSHGS